MWSRKQEKVLFDIIAFFDNVHKDRMDATIGNLGYSDRVKAWVLFFLSARRVCMAFNKTTSAEQEPPVGTPQGSPVSPLLSVLYTSPLLRLSVNLVENTTLGAWSS